MVTRATVKIHFWKMHGAGNDFVLFDDRDGSFPIADTVWRQRVSRPHLGIGCDGIILLQHSDTADFRMRFFNPDGNEAEMCGNGLRCAARLAHRLGIAPATLRVDTMAGPRDAIVSDTSVTIGMGTVSEVLFDQTLHVCDTDIPYHFINTGVPHTVVSLDDVGSSVDPLKTLAPAIRHHDAFAPQGTNVNFVQYHTDGAVQLRTYERGVEAETLACGTGATAAAIIAAHAGHCRPPVRVITAGGDVLKVDFKSEHDAFTSVTLTGPAEFVFEGDITYEDCLV
jgi:diaminopimelate epimerase